MNKKEPFVKLHAYISSDGIIDKWKSKDIHGKKLRIRERFRTRFYNNEETLIKDFINSVKGVYSNSKYIRYSKKRNEVEVRGQLISKNILSLGKVSSKDWEVPRNLTKNQKAIWIRAFADCDGTVNNYDYNRYVAIDSINLNGLKQISDILKELRIFSKVYKIKYKGYTSYRLKIPKKENLVKFNSLIGFNHPLKQDKLDIAIKSYK